MYGKLLLCILNDTGKMQETSVCVCACLAWTRKKVASWWYGRIRVQLHTNNASWRAERKRTQRGGSDLARQCAEGCACGARGMKGNAYGVSDALDETGASVPWIRSCIDVSNASMRLLISFILAVTCAFISSNLLSSCDITVSTQSISWCGDEMSGACSS